MKHNRDHGFGRIVRFSAVVAIISMSALAPASENSQRLEPGQFIGGFKNTYYYVVLETDYAGLPLNDSIRDMNGNVIARVNVKFRKATDIEGSARLADGRVINFSGIGKDGRIRYHVSKNPYGDGVGTCALDPFHTIAVDRRQIPLGSVVFIKETEGMELPDGTKHNGYWRTDDVGGAIKQKRIDLFIGERSFADALEKAGITHMKALHITMVLPPGPGNCADP